ncbi:ABC transporter substrate-binding protein [Roseomonas sp. NAR14]|uniref:ABC transporter substrate-binding protein n=1 Tax=Roseomonas acroporae TaxID=2937791 RepID=A0A9X1Y904_9PROT|nr:ABC transporter substrate-binding protein [Roseomonas acroporae]MCK8785347.1 ABC transporter substrate-binding protein [Roseomonas acroporae]
MSLNRRALLGVGTAALLPTRLRAQAAATIRIGVITDATGPYRDVAGPTAAACARQAATEFMAANPGVQVEVLMGDHQNKADLGVAIAREWFDRGNVDVLADVSNSAVALACGNIAVQKDKAVLATGTGSSEITGRACNPNTVHWTYDTWCTANATGGGLVRAGGNRWYFITADYAFGKAIQADTTRFVERMGGRVLGSAAYPFPGTTDFSSMLVQAQASGANVIAFANAGADLVNCVKQAGEFGITRRGTKLAAMVGFIQDVHGLGLQAAQGLTLTELFYWDMNDRTRAFTARVKPRLPGGLYPNMSQASAYSATLHYLKMAKEVGFERARASGRAVIEQMKRVPAEDDCFGTTTVRRDGRALHPAYLFEVKKPEESRGPWDYYRLVATIPADQAFRPLNEGGCPMVAG